jgi:hypothetical protein
MIKPMIQERPKKDRPKVGHYILTSRGWVKVTRSGHVPWVRHG